MSDLPKNWRKIAIIDLLEVLENGKRLHQGWSPQCHKEPSEDDHVWAVLKTTAIQNGQFLPEHNKRLPAALEPRPNIEVKNGDLLLTCAGPRVRCGIPCLIRNTRPKLMISGKMYRFRVDRSQILPEYLEAFLLSKDAQDAIDRMKTGISESGLNLTHSRFRTLEVPVPPLHEQRRIVGRIEELFSRLDAGVAALRQAKAQLQRYRQSVLTAAVTGELTKEWREQHPDTEPAANLLERVLIEREATWAGRGKYKLPDAVEGCENALPDGWVWTTLAHLSNHIADGTHKTPTYMDKGVPFLSAKDVNGFNLNFDNCRYIPREEHKELIKRCCPKHGNVLITKSGTIGRIAVVKTEVEFSLFESVANVPLMSTLFSDFIAYSSHVGIGGAFGAKNKKGVAVSHLHLEDLRRLPIPLPPLDEQHQIVAEVEARTTAIDHLEAELDQQLTRSNRLRQSTLQTAFCGKLLPPDE